MFSISGVITCPMAPAPKRMQAGHAATAVLQATPVSSAVSAASLRLNSQKQAIEMQKAVSKTAFFCLWRAGASGKGKEKDRLPTVLLSLFSFGCFM